MIHLKGVAKSSLVQILMQVLVPDSVSAHIWNEHLDFADMSTADVESISPSIVFALQRHGAGQLPNSLNAAFARASSASEAGALRMWTLLGRIKATLGVVQDVDGLLNVFTKTLIRSLGRSYRRASY